jgi:hypothetical protein
MVESVRVTQMYDDGSPLTRGLPSVISVSLANDE